VNRLGAACGQFAGPAADQLQRAVLVSRNVPPTRTEIWVLLFPTDECQGCYCLSTTTPTGGDISGTGRAKASGCRAGAWKTRRRIVAPGVGLHLGSPGRLSGRNPEHPPGHPVNRQGADERSHKTCRGSAHRSRCGIQARPVIPKLVPTRLRTQLGPAHPPTAPPNRRVHTAVLGRFLEAVAPCRPGLSVRSAGSALGDRSGAALGPCS